MTFNDTYRKYFQHQAETHPLLNHTEGSRVFEMINIQEALGDFRSVGQEKGFIMRGIWYTYNFSFSHEISKILIGGFIIAKYHSGRSGGSESFFEAMKESEMVTDHIIAKMVKDSKSGHPLFNYTFNDPSSANVQPKYNAGEAGYSGYLTTFRLSNFWNECAMQQSEPPLQWSDGGQTPHIL